MCIFFLFAHTQVLTPQNTVFTESFIKRPGFFRRPQSTELKASC